MSAMRVRRPDMRRAVVLLPNGFTLGNLFFGIFGIVSAARGDFRWAGWCIVLGGIMDAFDGRVARATKTGSRFGVELDSLVDAVSFGVAPSLIMYFAVLSCEGGVPATRGAACQAPVQHGWAWLFCFVFVACVVMRLARFNIEQGGRAKTQFHGLPSPAAGITLATYYWFSQTDLYQERLIGLPWQATMKGVMLALSVLMISHVLYPAVPTIGFKTLRGIVGTLVLLAAVVAVIVDPYRYTFPILVLYVTYGLVRSLFFGVVDRLPTGDPLDDDDGEDVPPVGVTSRVDVPFDDVDEDESIRPTVVAETPGGGVARKRRRRGRKRRDGSTPPNRPPASGAPPE